MKKAKRSCNRALGEEIEVIVISPSDEVHEQTLDGFARHLAMFADKIQAWCDSHPKEYEEGVKWYREYMAKQGEGAENEDGENSFAAPGEKTLEGDAV